MASGVEFRLYCIDFWGQKICLPPIPIPTDTPGVSIPQAETINEWLSEQITNAIIGLANGITDFKNKLADGRGRLIQGMVDAIKDPKQGGLNLLGIFLTVLTGTIISMALSSIAEVKAVLAFIDVVGKTIGDIARFAKLDLIITLARLGGLFNDEWHAALSELYVAFGAISEELETDFSYINAFAEVNRSILFTAYNLTDNAWLKAQAAYAEGLTTFIGGIESKLGQYVAHPDLVFVDIQKAISQEHTDESERQSAKVWAAIDKSTEWVETKGNLVIDEVEHIQETLDVLPSELRDAILSHVQPYLDRFDWFVTNQWEPFFVTYHEAQGIIADYFEAQGQQISDLQKRINDPFDIIDNLFLLTGGSAEKAADDLWRFVGGQREKDIDAAVERVNPVTIEVASIAPVPLPDIIGASAFAPPPANTPPPRESVSLPDATWFVGEETGAFFAPGAMPDNGTAWYFGG